ncbi:MAG: SMI1/KNR4 family protein [Opitutaceae bacterium]
MKDSHIASSNGGTTEAEISAFETKMQILLPSDYRSFLLKHDGGTLIENSVRIESEEWFELRTLYGLQGDENVLFSDLESMQDCYENSVPDDLLVIANDWGGNQFVMLRQNPHTIYWWDHESGEKQKIASNFSDLLSRIVPTPSEPLTNVEELAKNGKTEKDLDRYLRANDITPAICQEAARSGNIELLRVICARKLPLGDALKFASMNGNFEAFDYLLSTGISINSLLSDGRTALDWTEWKKEYASQLRTRGAKLSGEL